MPVDIASLRYQVLIGTGGIGSGIFFALDGDHTLGREESRSGRLLDRRDYCKLHIIAHYVKALLGPDFPVIPIGEVGADDTGQRLLSEMAEVGLDLRHVQAAAGRQTMYAVCFIYPDGSGGNLTTNDSACAYVDPTFVATAEAEFAAHAGRGIALAAPEVPLAARIQVLELGTRHRFLRVASFTSAEMSEVMDNDLLRLVDLLAVNLDEAAAAVGISPEGRAPEEIVRALVQATALLDTRLQIVISAGARGSWAWDGGNLSYLPAHAVEVVSTAGAGDAHLAGILTGLAAGLPLGRSHHLGVLAGAMSVTSPHTINKDINRATLAAFARQIGAQLPPEVMSLLTL